jgi:hypothetical protein
MKRLVITDKTFGYFLTKCSIITYERSLLLTKRLIVTDEKFGCY